MQNSAPPRRPRGATAALLAVALVVAWGVVWWLSRGTGAAGAVTALGVSAVVACGATAAWLRARRSTGADRHLWGWLGAGAVTWGVSAASTGWLGWTASTTDGAPVSVPTAALCLVTAGTGFVAITPVVRRSTSAGDVVRGGLDCALLTAVAAAVLWNAVLEPSRATTGPLAQVLAAILLLELLTAACMAHLAVQVHRRAPGLGVLAVGVVLLVVADVVSAVMGTSPSWPTRDVIAWSGALAMAALTAGAVLGSSLDRVEDAAASSGRRPLDGAVLPCTAALLALVTSVPTALGRGGADLIGAWLQLAVLLLLVLRALLLAHDGDRLTRGLEQRVERRTRDLAGAERRFASLVVHGSDVVTVVDADGVVTYASPSSQRVLGLAPQDLVGRALTSAVGDGGADGAAVVEALRLVRATPGARRELRTSARHASGRSLVLDVTVTNLLDDPAVQGVVLNAHDATEEVQLQEELSRRAFSDALTGLPNRALFRDRLEHALRGRGTRGSVEVVYLDLDGFKAVNDTLGHDAGDELLVAVAERLRAVVRRGDTVARLGGDEFAVLLDETEGGQEAEHLVQRLCDAVRRPFTVRGVEVQVATSAGLASSTTAGRDAGQLLRSADLAMYQAKAERQGGSATYHPRMHEQLAERVQLEADLRTAVEQGQFRVVYQPLVDLGSGGVSGVEALVRWHHPARGVVPPTEFIPAAESTGLIDAIGAFVLREACHQVATWRAEVPGAEAMRLSVNLSAHQLDDPHLVRDVSAALERAGLPATSLVLEITESALVDQHQGALDTLAALRRLGVRLAIDDFGTGYSSLSYLHRLPVDILKIDKSFVDRLADDGDTSLVDAILGMAATLQLTTVAEGVEHEHQRSALAAQGCATGQGYHFSPPVDAHLVPGLITASLPLGAAPHLRAEEVGR